MRSLAETPTKKVGSEQHLLQRFYMILAMDLSPMSSKQFQHKLASVLRRVRQADSPRRI